MSQTMPPPASAIRKLPIGATFAESHSLVFNNLDLLLKAAAIPYLMTVVLALSSLMALPNPGLVFLATILFFVPYTLFGVAWHRLILLGPGVSPPRIAPNWRRQHWRFFGYALAVTVISYVLWLGATILSVLFIIPLGAAGMFASETSALYVFGIAAAIGGIGFAYLMIRFSFVFPAVAVGETYRLRHAWTHSRGQGFRLIGMLILTALPITLVAWLLQYVLGLLMFENTNLLMTMGEFQDVAAIREFAVENFVPIAIFYGISNVPGYLLMAVIVSAISIAFRTCTGWVPAEAGGAAEPGS